MERIIFISVMIFTLTFCGFHESRPSLTAEEYYTPVLFVHGISSNGSLFNQLYEKLVSQDFPEKYLFNALLPRIGIGKMDPNYAWYDYSVTGYDKAQWELSGNSAQNVPALKQQIDLVLSSTGKDKLDLVSHSNGTAVVRELLSRYPDYAVKIRKCVFISGFAKVSDAKPYNTITMYLSEPDIARNLPAGIRYYNLTSPADDNIVMVEKAGAGRLFDPKEVPGSVNFEIAGHDHLMVVSSNEAFKKIYTWLTGLSLKTPTILSQVDLGGRIVYYPNPYEQEPKGGVKLKVNYYNPEQGTVMESGLPEVLSDPNGIWRVSGVAAEPGLRICLSITRSDGKAKSIYFFADRIAHHNLWLNFVEPDLIRNATGKGQILLTVSTYAEFLSRLGNTGGKPANHLKATIESEGLVPVSIADGEALPNLAPWESNTSIILTNFLASTVETTGNIYNFKNGSAAEYADKTVTVTLSLYQGRTQRPPVKVRINGNDLWAHKSRPYILYLKTAPE